MKNVIMELRIVVSKEGPDWESSRFLGPTWPSLSQGLS